MKKLHLLRHAKSSWGHPGLADHDRPLARRGLRACDRMAEPLVEAGCCFDRVFCSTAARAQQTLEAIAESLGKDIHWNSDAALYTFSASALLDWCRRLDDALPEVLVVGHNPAITNLANGLGDHVIANVPTCGYLQLALQIDHWDDMVGCRGRIVTFLKPSMFY